MTGISDKTSTSTPWHWWGLALSVAAIVLALLSWFYLWAYDQYHARGRYAALSFLYLPAFARKDSGVYSNVASSLLNRGLLFGIAVFPVSIIAICICARFRLLVRLLAIVARAGDHPSRALVTGPVKLSDLQRRLPTAAAFLHVEALRSGHRKHCLWKCSGRLTRGQKSEKPAWPPMAPVRSRSPTRSTRWLFLALDATGAAGRPSLSAPASARRPPSRCSRPRRRRRCSPDGIFCPSSAATNAGPSFGRSARWLAR